MNWLELQCIREWPTLDIIIHLFVGNMIMAHWADGTNSMMIMFAVLILIPLRVNVMAEIN